MFLYLATNWASGEDDHVVARAEYDFSAASEEEISMRVGDMLNLAPKGESSLITIIYSVLTFLSYKNGLTHLGVLETSVLWQKK